MKFKVVFNVRPNMFGRIEGSHSLISDDSSTLHSIDWFLNEIIFSKIKDKKIFKILKKQLFNELKKLAIGEEKQIVNKEERSIILIERVDDNVTMGDLLEELYGDLFF